MAEIIDITKSAGRLRPREGDQTGGLVPEKIRFYRCRLECLPPRPIPDLLAKAQQLDELARKVEAAQTAYNTLAAELGSFGIQVPFFEEARDCGLPLDDDGQSVETFRWSLADGAWGYTEPATIRGHIIEDYASRPSRGDAVEVWNQYFSALQRTPRRLFRVRGRGYFVEMCDKLGRVIRFRADDLNGRGS